MALREHVRERRRLHSRLDHQRPLRTLIQTRQRRAINQGPAAVVEALTKTPNAGLEEAEKFGDKEHINSIEKHLADYASERRERIADAEGGHLDTRQAAAANSFCQSR